MIKKRLKIFSVLIFALSLVLILAEARIAFLNGGDYAKKAAAQRSHTIEVKKYRGLFFDRNMIPLTDSKTRLFTSGVATVNPTVRYPYGSVAEHIIGYVNSDGEGVSGLEKCFDSTLTTKNTLKLSVLVGASGAPIDNTGVGVTDEGGGMQNVRLTLDFHIQKIAEDALDNAGISGAAVVLDVQSSDVLAMASRPGFDRNDISESLATDDARLVNRCISQYNAGSIFKIITSAAALESGAVSPDTPFYCSGAVNIDGRDFACHLKEGHGALGFESAFANSCNCAFYSIGAKIGAEQITSAARAFGLGERILCFDGLEEARGNIPRKDSYGIYEAVNYSIGQGEILITPVQAANVAAIVANNGVANCVNIADAIVDESGAVRRNIRETASRRVMRRDTALEIQRCMTLAVHSGTASGAKSDTVSIAGKTGTAQTGWFENGENLVHGWFCGYFPSDNPKYAMAVLVENGKSGSAAAVPVFKEIAEQIAKIYPMG